MSTRAFVLAVTGFALSVAACSSYGTSVVEVENKRAAVASVSVTIPTSLEAGQTARAVAIPKDAQGVALNDRTILWYSSSGAIASISDSGMIAAVAPGTTVVSAVSEGVAGQATMSVIPRPTPVATLTVAVTPSSAVVGQTAVATAVLQDSSGNPISGQAVTWESSDVTVATVDATGKVKATKAGNASIKASSSGKSNSSVFTVNAPAPAPVASVSVAPATSNLQVGGTAQLSATTRDASNNLLTGRTVTWSSSNTAVSTVSASGFVTAVAAGSATITATSETKTGTAAINVASPTVPVASVSVSPSTSSAQVGSTVPFSATTRDVNNNVLTNRVVTWSSSNGTVASVSASGVATALAAGTAQITATSEGKSGSATLTVTAPPPPPPPPPGGAWRANEPSGMTSISERAFNSLAETGWGTMAGPGASIVADATAPQSPSNVLRFNYPAGMSGGGAPESSSLTIADYRVVYLAYWVKYSPNWQGHLTAINKQGYVWFGNTPAFVIESEGIGSGTLHSRMAIQYSLVQPNSSGWYPQNLVPSAAFRRGEWDLVEIVLTANSAGTADGAIDWWLNGVHVGSYGGIQWSSAATLWSYVRIDPVWGGIGDTVSSDQYMALDHYYISGKR